MKILLIIIFSVSLFANYKLIPGKRQKSAIDRLRFGQIMDFKTIPQNLSFYAKQVEPFSSQKMLRLDREYNQKYFMPWSITEIREARNELFWQVKFVQRRKIYDGSRRVISPSRWKYWIKNSNFDALNTLNLRAITVRHSNIRAFPTMIGAYTDPTKPTHWFPFDYFQHSAIYPNTPLFISHYSKDKRWAFIEAPFTSGWIKRADIALVDDSFINSFKSGRYAITIKDDLWLVGKGKIVSLVKLGTIFPYNKRGNLIVATKDSRGYAKLETLQVLSRGLVAKKPLQFNAKNVALIAKELHNEPYGWGGKMQTRDCSATTRDFFAPFGIFLPRNSGKQAKVGSKIRIKGIPKELKKATIIKYAKPFQSMLFVPGHIGIYLGRYKNEPVIMHTYWGVRLKDFSKYPLCRTIITTTEPGKELPNIREKSKLINTLKYIINF